MKTQNISSLEELKRRKRELRLSKKVAIRELSHSLDVTRDQLGPMLLKKVAIPAGATGLAVLGAKKLLDDDNPQEQQMVQQNVSVDAASVFSVLNSIARIILPK